MVRISSISSRITLARRVLFAAEPVELYSDSSLASVSRDDWAMRSANVGSRTSPVKFGG